MMPSFCIVDAKWRNLCLYTHTFYHLCTESISSIFTWLDPGNLEFWYALKCSSTSSQSQLFSFYCPQPIIVMKLYTTCTNCWGHPHRCHLFVTLSTLQSLHYLVARTPPFVSLLQCSPFIRQQSLQRLSWATAIQRLPASVMLQMAVCRFSLTAPHRRVALRSNPCLLIKFMFKMISQYHNSLIHAFTLTIASS